MGVPQTAGWPEHRRGLRHGDQRDADLLERPEDWPFPQVSRTRRCVVRSADVRASSAEGGAIVGGEGQGAQRHRCHRLEPPPSSPQTTERLINPVRRAALGRWVEVASQLQIPSLGSVCLRTCVRKCLNIARGERGWVIAVSVLSYIKVENFRSIRSVTLHQLGDYSPIAGLNSAGKSNILRALHLFFMGTVDESRAALNFQTDYSSHAPSGKKKEIAVTVGIRLGEFFRVPRQQDFEASHGITDVVYIRRRWNLALDNVSPQDSFSFGASLGAMTDAAPNEVSALLGYIRAVRFVYIPNHSRPADLIRRELTPLRGTLVQRLRSTTVYKKTAVNDLLQELASIGDRMFGDVSDQLVRGLPGTTVSANLPADFADLVFDVGVNAISGGEARAPEFEGSGAQSFLLLHILDLADRTRRAGGFGWVQASVWAIEEPESFLHAGLRAQFSTDLASYAAQDRRQVLVTTHQDEFLRVAEEVLTARKTDNGTTVTRSDARDAITETTKLEITSFRHPLFVHTDLPMVIVEGKFDAVHLRAALQSLALRPRWRLVAPQAAFGQEVGGDSIYGFLNFNRAVIASRPTASPVIVLRDWEATDVAKYDKVLAVHPYSKALICDSGCVNPELSEDFVGIERYLGTALIEKCVPTEKLGLEHSGHDARRTIKRKDLESAKPALASEVTAGADPGTYMQFLAQWLDNEVMAIIGTIPPSAFTS